MHVEVPKLTEYIAETRFAHCSASQKYGWITCVTAVAFGGFKRGKFIEQPDGGRRSLCAF